MVADSPGVLDLSREGIAASFHAGSYDEICAGSRRAFVDFVDGISADNAGNIDWWVSSASSRNEILSRLFHDFAVVRLAGTLLDRDSLPGVLVVDSAALRGVLQRLAMEREPDRHIRFQQKHSMASRVVQSVRRALSPLRSAGRLFYEWAVVNVAARRFRGPEAGRGDVTLVDTFALSDRPDQDRYFPGLWEHADPGERSSIWFAPQFWGYRLPDLPRLVRSYAGCERNHLFKERFLSLRDLVWSALHVWRRRRINLQSAWIDGLDCADIVRHDLKQSGGVRCAMRGLLNYRFIMNLHRRGIRLRKAVDWFENHPMDRGWNAAVNRVYGSDKAVGYQGFYPAFDAARITGVEYQSGVVPAELVMMGPGFRPETTEFCRALKTAVGPAFRYAGLDRGGAGPRRRKGKDLLVALPYSKPSTVQMCSAVDELSRDYTDRRFIVKPHPANRQSVTDLLPERDNVMVVDEALSAWFPCVSLVICGAESTVVLEAMTSGNPVILMGRTGRMYQVSVPAAAPPELWRACATAGDVSKAIGLFEAMPEESHAVIDPRELEELFFTPVTDETVRAFLAPPAAERCS